MGVGVNCPRAGKMQMRGGGGGGGVAARFSRVYHSATRMIEWEAVSRYFSPSIRGFDVEEKIRVYVMRRFIRQGNDR